ncbi:hypothetical protein HYX13_05790 [Candidatus Woesearchaeota archaeon]|nr:hypothetical protein [Candidatus Woesearchaeota archaeon]
MITIPHYVWETVLQQTKQDLPFLTEFCATYHVKLEGITVTSERAPEIPREAMYIFNDGLGGYTIDGIKNSLEQEVVEELERIKKLNGGKQLWH